MAHVHVRELNFLVHQVNAPDFHTVVIDAEKLGVGVVKEPDLVGCASADGVSTDSLSRFNIPDDELVVILPSKRGEMLLIEGEGKTLDENLVQLESLHQLQGIKVPDNDISLEAHVSLLARSNVLSRRGDRDN